MCHCLVRFLFFLFTKTLPTVNDKISLHEIIYLHRSCSLKHLFSCQYRNSYPHLPEKVWWTCKSDRICRGCVTNWTHFSWISIQQLIETIIAIEPIVSNMLRLTKFRSQRTIYDQTMSLTIPRETFKSRQGQFLLVSFFGGILRP